MESYTDMTFRIWSDDFEDGGKMALANAFNGWGHAGENRSPHLAWDGAPEGTQSFSLTMLDITSGQDVPWWHWVAFNIPVGITSLPAGAGAGLAALPSGVIQPRTDYGTSGYGGPAPGPDATNLYRFTIFALPVPLDLDENASCTMVSYLSNDSCLAKAQIVGRYI